MAKDDLKAKQKIANERQLTINMLIYIGKSNLKKINSKNTI